MTTQVFAESALPGVEALVLLGFPLHPARRPGVARAEHLARVTTPMLLLSGDRDALAEPALLRATAAGLGPRATLRELPGADHGFAVPRRAGWGEADVLGWLAEETAGWLDRRPAA
jgi:hypothetical protein